MSEAPQASNSITCFDDTAAICRQACDDMIRLARDTIQQRGVFRLSLSGGSTPRMLYELMAQRKDEFDWNAIEMFWGDERNVPPDDDQSNYRMVCESLLNHIPYAPENIFAVPIDVDDPEKAAKQYEGTLKERFGGAELDWDLVLLGMGDDAHTASLFPETEAIDRTDRLFVENWVPKLDCFRLTLTSPAINSARNVWFMIGGAAKRPALTKVWSDEELSSRKYPSRLIHPSAGNLRWLVTSDAMP